MELIEYKNKIINVDNGCLHLQGLGINNINDLKGLEKFRDLEALYLYANQIKEIEGLNSLVNLRVLLLHYNQITEIKGLENLKSLEVLNLLGNQIIQIRGIENLTNLKILNLSENLISEIKGLSNLTNLEQLYLNENRISHINGLEKLKKLRLFFVKGNPIPKGLLDRLGGLTPDGRAIYSQKFVDYCKKTDDDMNIKVEFVLDPIPMGGFEETLAENKNEAKATVSALIIKDQINSNLLKIPILAKENKFLEALELLEKSKELTIKYEFYELADEMHVKIQDIKFQRTNFHIDNALMAFNNTTVCTIYDISEYLSLHLPDFNMNERKLKLKVLSRMNSLNMKATLHEDSIIFKEYDLSQRFLDDISDKTYSYNKKECIYCGENIDVEAIICPICGIDQEER